MTGFESNYAEMLDKGFEAEVDGMTSPKLMPQGDRALYRAVFRGMQVHGLPEELTVAGATLRFHQGPVLVQQTDLSQRAGYPLVFDKSMNHGVPIGEGHWLTLVEIEIDDYVEAPKRRSPRRDSTPSRQSPSSRQSLMSVLAKRCLPRTF